MDKVIEKNKAVLLTLTNQIRELHKLFMNMYKANTPYIKNVFYNTLQHNYSYMIYHPTEKKYMLVRLIAELCPINATVEGECYETRLGVEIIPYDSHEPLLENGDSFQDVFNGTRQYMECMVGRKVNPKELCVFINTETLLAASVNLLFWKLVLDKNDEDISISSINAEKVSQLWKSMCLEYQSNISIAASSMSTLMERQLEKFGFKFSIIPLVVLNSTFDIEIKCYPTVPLPRPVIDPTS